MSKLILVLTAGLSLFFMTNASAHSWYRGWYGHHGWHRYGGPSIMYFYPGNYFPYYHTYRNYPSIYPYPTDINSCPLVASYYDPYGNWVPPTRVCPIR